MKQLLITIAAVVLVGCGESQESAPSSEATPVEPVAKAATPEPQTAKAPDISIHDGAKDENIEVVKQHLAAGTDVNAKDRIRCTALHWAALVGNNEIAELLIANAADVNAKGDDGRTPLHDAVVNGHKEIAKLLIAEGADVNTTDGERTPLHIAALKCNKETTELLITKGAGECKGSIFCRHTARCGHRRGLHRSRRPPPQTRSQDV